MPDFANLKIAVIGAGLGGMSAAISLAAAGFTVEVFEKNDRPGGKLNVLSRDGFCFDLGPSILTMPHIFRSLFERAGKNLDDYVELVEVVPHWRNFFEDGFCMDLHPDMRLMERELAKLPEGSSEGFYRFLEYSRRLCMLTEEGYFRKGLDTFAEMVGYYGPRRSYSGFDVLRVMDAGVRKYIKSEKLVDILDYFIKYVGSSPYDAPALMNLLPYVQFGYGLWHVRGGMYGLARALERCAAETGVRFHYNAEVTGITHDEAAARCLTVNHRDSIRADIIVSNMELIPAYRDLLQESPSFLKRYERFAPSCSGLVLHLGIDTRYPQLAHHNFFYSRDSRKHFRAVFKESRLSGDPTLYVVAPCKTDEKLAPPGCEIIKVLPHIPHIDDRNPHTRADYGSLRERVLDKLERMGMTGLRGRIIAEAMWTPVDIQRQYYSNKGSIYGVVADRFKNFGFKAPKKSEKYKNLYFVGGSVNPGGGMPMVTLSGQLACDKIVKDFST